MRSRTRPLLIGLAAALLIPASVPASQAAPSPSRYRHPVGFTLAVPAGWSVQAGEANTLQLTPRDKDPNEIYLITAETAAGIRSISDPRLVPEVESDLLPIFPFLTRAGRSESIRTALGPGVRLAWEGESPTGVAARAETYVVLTGGRAIALLAVGPRDRIVAHAGTLRGLFAGFSPERPVAKAVARAAGKARMTSAQSARGRGGEAGSPLAKSWRQRLSGKKLTYLSSYSSGSSGGYNSQYEIYLDPSGRFSYSSNSSVSIYVPGATGTSVDQDAKQGTWRIVSRGSQAILELVPSGEKTQQFALTSQDGKTFLNGRRFFVTDP
jgi:hypothetical protein